MTKKERRRRSAKESSHEKNFQWLVERADRHLSGKRHEINERSEFMNDPARRRRRRWSGVSDMNDREKAGTSEHRNEGDYNAGVPRTSSTLWMKDTICSFEGTKKSTGNIV